MASIDGLVQNGDANTLTLIQQQQQQQVAQQQPQNVHHQQSVNQVYTQNTSEVTSIQQAPSPQTVSHANINTQHMQPLQQAISIPITNGISASPSSALNTASIPISAPATQPYSRIYTHAHPPQPMYHVIKIFMLFFFQVT